MTQTLPAVGIFPWVQAIDCTDEKANPEIRRIVKKICGEEAVKWPVWYVECRATVKILF